MSTGFDPKKNLLKTPVELLKAECIIAGSAMVKYGTSVPHYEKILIKEFGYSRDRFCKHLCF